MREAAKASRFDLVHALDRRRLRATTRAAGSHPLPRSRTEGNLSIRVSLRSVLLPLLLGILIPGAARATTVRPLNIEELTEKAGRIVSGQVVAIDVSTDPALDLPVARVTLAVQRTLKGSGGSTLAFRMLAPSEAATTLGVRGLPSFDVGEEVVLFLYPESRTGLTSPVGLTQGKFVKVTDKQGRTLAVNGFANRSLLRNLSPAARQRVGTVLGTESDPVTRPRVLLQMVEALAP